MNKKILTLLVSLVLLVSSCTKFLGVDEVNPNSASAVPPKLLLPAALTNVVKTMDNPRRFEFVYLWFGLWSVSQGYAQPSALMQYNVQNNTYQAAFRNLYTTGQNFKQIEKEATDPNDAGYVAIAMIMNAYIMQNLVDIWGDVPYSQAFSAETGNFKPKYDDQKAIYEDEVLKLDAAIKLIQGLTVNATAISPSSDVMFGGNMDLWAKFANTLKLRMLVHQSGMTGRDAYIKTALATTSSVGFLGAGESAMVNPGFVESDTKMNPFYEVFFNGAGAPQSDATAYYFAGKDAVDFMTDSSDPRLSRFFQPFSGTVLAGTAKFAGNYLGQDVVAHPPFLPGVTSKLAVTKVPDEKGVLHVVPGYLTRTPTESSPVLIDFESLFIQAEAVQRGYITGDAKALYSSAVTRSFIHMGLTAIDANTFLEQPKYAVNFDLPTDKIGLILTQKWLALNGISPVEIWTDYRRSGYPLKLHFSEQADRKSDTPPVRLPYTAEEVSSNNENVLAVGTIDPFTSKIFWQIR